MTPKEKAEELVRKYTMHAYRGSVPLHIHVQAIKKYALIAVDEIIQSTSWQYLTEGLDYWQEVKEEIEKL
jgi:hypothetical protein